MVFVTGGTGFLGSHLLKYLIDSGKTVRALRRPNSDLFFLHDYADKIEWVEGDVTDIYCLSEGMTGAEQVYHAAAVISFDPKKKHEMMRINVEGTANVVNMCLENHVKKLCHVSSIAALGRTANGELITEANQWEPNKLNSEYSLSKFRAEREVWRGIEEGLDSVIVNPSVIIGAGSWDRFSAKLFNVVWKGLPYYPAGTTGYVDVRDVAKIMIQLMDSDIKNERFILNSQNVSFRDLFYYIADAIHKKRPAIQVNSLLANFAWRMEAARSFFTGKEPLVTRETATISRHSFYYDNSKIRKALGYDFIPVRETISEAGVQYLEHKKML